MEDLESGILHLKLRSLAPVLLLLYGLARLLDSAGVSQAQPAPASASSPPSLTLISQDGRRPIALTVVGDQEFVALEELASVFQLTVREDSLGAITVSFKGKTIVLTPDQALASVAGKLISLTAAPLDDTRGRGARRHWLVPVEFISRALSWRVRRKADLASRRIC
jgi:hypothetical protein